MEKRKERYEAVADVTVATDGKNVTPVSYTHLRSYPYAWLFWHISAGQLKIGFRIRRNPQKSLLLLR